EREGKKELFENGEKRKSLGNFYREIPVATFLLDDVEKVKGPPEKRRQLLDEIIISMRPAYKYLKREFEKILSHRNALLKLHSKESLIEVWDKKFAESSYHLAKERENASVELNKKYEIVFKKFIGDKNVTSFIYDSNIKGKDILEIMKALKSNREKETRVGRSLIGPQRDDLRIVSGKSKSMRIFGSEGEQKLISIFIKLAQKEILKERTGMSPVLIVDDPFSEIDEKFVCKIIEALKESDQVILSSLRPDVLKEQAASLIEIVDGAVVSVG
ncbi:MAG: DNA replication/repair protein RecF, partial [Actinomycetia bacterium]|nr:DNA replication/repair protein RecF [Actinomycetes bacterium]